MFQQWCGLLVELAELSSRGLGAIASFVEIAKFREDVVANGVGAAAARIVRQPPSIGCLDQMMRNDHALLHAKPQAIRITKDLPCSQVRHATRLRFRAYAINSFTGLLPSGVSHTGRIPE